MARIPSTTKLRVGRFLSSGTWRNREYPVGGRRPVVNGGKPVRALVVTDATPMGVRQRNLGLVVGALDAANIPYFCRPTDSLRSSVVVAVKFLDDAVAALRAGTTQHVVMEVHKLKRVDSSITAGLHLEPTQTTIRLYDAVTSATGTWTLGHRYACDVEFWSDASDGRLVSAVPDGRDGIVKCDDPETMAYGWQLCQRVARSDSRQYRTKQSILSRGTESVTFPIDAVFTWVDGSDSEWQAGKHAALVGRASELHQMAANDSRFASRDELRYALRSVICNAPWIRRIFLVTADQVPPWLDLEHAGVTVIRHREIFGDVGTLPTFNSHAIEARLHHIPDLAEHFIYFNDDMFLGRPMLPRQFFHANGLAKFFPSAAAIDPAPTSVRDLPVTAAAKNNRELIASRFGTTIRQKMRHAPYALRRSVLEEIEDELAERVGKTASHQFRHREDLSIPSSLAHYWAFATGRAVPGNIDMIYVDIGDHHAPTRLASLLARRRSDVFCLNDTDTDADPDQTAMVTAFLRGYFPFRAAFELPDDVTAERARRSATQLLNEHAYPAAIPRVRRESTISEPRFI
jgi:hypothetical protein